MESKAGPHMVGALLTTMDRPQLERVPRPFPSMASTLRPGVLACQEPTYGVRQVQHVYQEAHDSGR